ncbi:MAG: DNA alkylation repair protein [Bacteroidota bacterium]
MIEELKKELLKKADPKRAKSSYKFFRSYEGGYGEGDEFMGITVPDQRAIAKKYYKAISVKETGLLLLDKYHEHRLTAVIILSLKYEKAKTEIEKESIVNEYLKNISGVNNWDIVDSSAHKILGPFYIDKDKKLLYELLDSNNLWKQRIAIIATMHFIRQGLHEETLKMSEMMLNHKHDLIHKAVGWMLREIGNRNYEVEYNFLEKHYNKMPRTMLRYAIEKFDEDIRQKFLKGKI